MMGIQFIIQEALVRYFLGDTVFILGLCRDGWGTYEVTTYSFQEPFLWYVTKYSDLMIDLRYYQKFIQLHTQFFLSWQWVL